MTDGTVTDGTVTDGTVTDGTVTGAGTTQALTPVNVTIESQGAKIALPALILLGLLIGLPLLILGSRAVVTRLASPISKAKRFISKAKRFLVRSGDIADSTDGDKVGESRSRRKS